MTLRLRLRLLRHDLDRRLEKALMFIARHTPKRVLRAMLVELACRATAQELIGPHAYAGPDGVDYERMWHALDGQLPKHRAHLIRAPAE